MNARTYNLFSTELVIDVLMGSVHFLAEAGPGTSETTKKSVVSESWMSWTQIRSLYIRTKPVKSRKFPHSGSTAYFSIKNVRGGKKIAFLSSELFGMTAKFLGLSLHCKSWIQENNENKRSQGIGNVDYSKNLLASIVTSFFLVLTMILLIYRTGWMEHDHTGLWLDRSRPRPRAKGLIPAHLVF